MKVFLFFLNFKSHQIFIPRPTSHPTFAWMQYSSTWQIQNLNYCLRPLTLPGPEIAYAQDCPGQPQCRLLLRFYKFTHYFSHYCTPIFGSENMVHIPFYSHSQGGQRNFPVPCIQREGERLGIDFQDLIPAPSSSLRWMLKKPTLWTQLARKIKPGNQSI